jgi:hypothetical protein
LLGEGEPPAQKFLKEIFIPSDLNFTYGREGQNY